MAPGSYGYLARPLQLVYLAIREIDVETRAG